MIWFNFYQFCYHLLCILFLFLCSYSFKFDRCIIDVASKLSYHIGSDYTGAKSISFYLFFSFWFCFVRAHCCCSLCNCDKTFKVTREGSDGLKAFSVALSNNSLIQNDIDDCCHFPRKIVVVVVSASVSYSIALSFHIENALFIASHTLFVCIMLFHSPAFFAIVAATAVFFSPLSIFLYAFGFAISICIEIDYLCPYGIIQFNIKLCRNVIHIRE